MPLDPPERATLTSAQISEIAERAATKAVEAVFRRLRIKLHDDESVDEFIDNQRFVTDLREARHKMAVEARDGIIRALGKMVVPAVMGAGAAVVAWFGIHKGTP